MVSGLPGARLGRVANVVEEENNTEAEPVKIQHHPVVEKAAPDHLTSQKSVTRKHAQVKQFICFTCFFLLHI